MMMMKVVSAGVQRNQSETDNREEVCEGIRRQNNQRKKTRDEKEGGAATGVDEVVDPYSLSLLLSHPHLRQSQSGKEEKQCESGIEEEMQY